MSPSWSEPESYLDKLVDSIHLLLECYKKIFLRCDILGPHHSCTGSLWNSGSIDMGILGTLSGGACQAYEVRSAEGELQEKRQCQSLKHMQHAMHDKELRLRLLLG